MNKEISRKGLNREFESVEKDLLALETKLQVNPRFRIIMNKTVFGSSLYDL